MFGSDDYKENRFISVLSEVIVDDTKKINVHVAMMNSHCIKTIGLVRKFWRYKHLHITV